MNFAIFNDFQKVLKAQGCPSCGISIIKGPGCKHMTCQKCRHEFCWYCLGDYFNYSHSNTVLFCPFRNILKFILYLYIITLTVNLKLCIQYTEYGNFMKDAAEQIGIVLLANVLSLSIFIFIIFYVFYSETRRGYGCCQSICCLISFLMMLLWPVMYITGLVLAYIYWPLGRKMAKYLLWQWIGIIGGSFITFIVILIVKWIGSWLQARRYRRQLNALYTEQPNYYENFPYYDNNALLTYSNVPAEPIEDTFDRMRRIDNSIDLYVPPPPLPDII